MLLAISSQAQFVTENTMTVEEYVQTVLLGDGVQVSNVTYNGLPGNQNQPRVGYFNGENSDFYFDEGLMMATRNIQIATCGPEDDNSGMGVEPDLAQLINLQPGQNLNDVTVVEFDFIPQGDTLSFQYVFASREYNVFVCSQFNDVFGFFLSGPGINGPFSNNAENIAVLPNGTEVAINNVNNGSPNGVPCTYDGVSCPCNSEFFTNNGSGQGTGVHSDLCFGGYTVPLTAEAIVQCGLTYHIKLAIANKIDGGLQSAVFLEGGSFASSAPIEVDLAVSSGINDSTLVEGCGGATFTFNRDFDFTEQTIYFSFDGTAENGVDFTAFPDSLVFPIGVTEISYTIEAFHDGIVEGLESMTLIVDNENVCGGEALQSEFTFYIDEYPVLEAEAEDAFVDCGEPVVLAPTITGGNPPYTYQWSSGEVTPSITVAPDETTTYTLTVIDSCNIQEVSVDMEVEVAIYDTLMVDVGESWSLNCLVDMIIDPQIEGGSGDFTYEWFDNGTLVSNDPMWNELPDGDGVITLVVTDHCGNTDQDTLSYVTPPVQVNVSLESDYFVSCIDETPIPSWYSGGVGQLSFEWFENGVLIDSIPSIQYQTDETSELILVVTDECGNFQSDTVTVHVPDIPLEMTMATDTLICVGGRANLWAEAAGGEGGFSYQWEPILSNEPEFQVWPVDTTVYHVTAYDICGDSISGEVTVNTTAVHAEFELDYVGTNGVAFTNLSTPDVNYVWNFGDGFKSNLFEPEHEYYFAGNYYITLSVTDSLGCNDQFSMAYNPPMFLYIPTSFTPNGDGINEVFKAQGVSVKSFEMSIYNRQGELLFHTEDIEQGWNGSANGSSYYVPNGVYVVTYKAESYDGQKIEDSGRVTIIR